MKCILGKLESWWVLKGSIFQCWRLLSGYSRCEYVCVRDRCSTLHWTWHEAGQYPALSRPFLSEVHRHKHTYGGRNKYWPLVQLRHTSKHAEGSVCKDWQADNLSVQNQITQTHKSPSTSNGSRNGFSVYCVMGLSLLTFRKFNFPPIMVFIKWSVFEVEQLTNLQTDEYSADLPFFLHQVSACSFEKYKMSFQCFASLDISEKTK